MVIYKEQAITDLAIPEQQAVVKNPLEDIATKMAETYDKEVKALNMEQDNNAKQSIQMAFETYKDDPVMFEQTVNKTIGGLSEKLRTPEDKVEFLAKAEMTKSLYKNRAEINYQAKVDKQYQERYQADVDLGMASVKENLMLIHTGGKGASLVTAELGKLKTIVDQKDSKGNYLLTRVQRTKALDLIDNAEFYGALSYAQYLKATDDNVNLDLEYSAYEKDLKGKFSPEQKNKLLEAFKPSKENTNTYEQVQAEVGFKSAIEFMDIKDGTINNDKSSMGELFNTINDLDIAYNNKQVSKQFYSSNMPKLKSTYYQMDEKKLFKNGTVGSEIINSINNGLAGYTKSGIDSKEAHFDMMSRYQTALEKASIPLDSTNTTAKDRAKTIIIEENAKYYKSSFGATDEEVKDEASQVKFVNKVKNEISLRKAESLAGLPFGSLAKQAQENINEVKAKPKEEKPKQKPDLMQQYFKEEYTDPALDKAKEGIGNIVSGIGEVSSKVQGKISKKIGSRLKL